jgi:glutamate synthase (NADPH/NADH) large chain
MMRKCHLNTCPVGVATQDPVLRQKFTGQPEHVVNYFFFVAEEAREHGAHGPPQVLRSGRPHRSARHAQGIEHWKASGLDFSKIFYQPKVPADVARSHCEVQDHGLERRARQQPDRTGQPALERGEKVVIETPISNVNRTVGTMLSQRSPALRPCGSADDTITVKLTGTAGQSFAAFLAHGITFELAGEGNDYVGKGLSGGKIASSSVPGTFNAKPSENIIVGNTVMYGATAGEVYFRGVAGERFAVRNSGALPQWWKGTGDHGCEYMTGGTVVVLGQTGRNFAAGMSGGMAYVLDADGLFEKRCNLAMVTLEKVLPANRVSNGRRHAQPPGRRGHF